MRVTVTRDKTSLSFLCGEVAGGWEVNRATVSCERGVTVVVQAPHWKEFLVIFQRGHQYSPEELGSIFAEIKRLAPDSPTVVVHRDPPVHLPELNSVRLENGC